MEDRRRAPRYSVPENVLADVSSVPVKVVELSLVGARVEHTARLPLAGPQFTIVWQGKAATGPIRIVRSEVAGQGAAGGLVYRTALRFPDEHGQLQALIALVLRDGEVEPITTAPIPPPAASAPAPSLDDSWVRRVFLMKDEEEDETLPYAQYRLHASGWRKEYVSTPDQPPDGFTITRGRLDFDELQRTFEAADEDTRRMMQIAMRSELERSR